MCYSVDAADGYVVVVGVVVVGVGVVSVSGDMIVSVASVAATIGCAGVVVVGIHRGACVVGAVVIVYGVVCVVTVADIGVGFVCVYAAGCLVVAVCVGIVVFATACGWTYVAAVVVVICVGVVVGGNV